MSPLAALLGAYLRMSLRGKSAGTFFTKRGGKWRGTAALGVLYFSLGTIAALGASGSRSAFSYPLVLHAMTFVMLGMSLAAEAGDVLFNPAEQDVLGHLPIGGGTLVAAKAASLFGFALLLALSMNVPALFFASRIPDLRASFPAVHLGATVVLALFVTATIVFAYAVLVRFAGRRRFESIAAWSQAALSGAFLALSQGLAHVVELPILGLESRLCLVFPPAWFAAIDVLGAATYRPRAALLAAFAGGTTVFLTAFGLTRLAGAFPAASVRLLEAAPLRTRQEGDAASAGRFVGWWVRDPIERAAFRLAAAYLRRDREIRTRLYPAFGFFVLLPVAQLIGNAAYRFRAAALVAIILLGMLPSLALEALRVSSQHAATELFAVVPLASAGPLFQGVRKAVTCYVLAPATLVAVVWVAIVSPGALPIAVPSLIALPAWSLLPAAFRDYVPLSVPPTMGRQSIANVVIGATILVTGVTTIALATVTARTGHLGWLIGLEVLLLGPAYGLLSRHIGKRPLLA